MSERIVTSPYLERVPARLMRAASCAYCCRPLKAGCHNLDKYRQTNDHILPRARGRVFPGVTNKRPCCYECNQLRSRLNHCSALLVLLIEECRRLHLNKSQAVIWFGAAPSSADRLALRRWHESERKRRPSLIA